MHLYFHTVGGMSSGNFLEVGLLNGGINACIVWWGIAICPPIGLTSFCISTSYEQECLFAHTHPLSMMSGFWIFISVLDKEVVSQYNFHLLFSNYRRSWTFFHRFEVCCVPFFSELVFHDFHLFFWKSFGHF